MSNTEDARAELMRLLDANYDSPADEPESWENWRRRNAAAILAAGYRKFEITDDMVGKAALEMHRCGWPGGYGWTAYLDMARAALNAVLGSGDPEVQP